MSSRRGEKTDEAGVYRRDDGRYVVVATAKSPETGKVEQRQKTLKKGETLQDAIETRESLKSEIRTPKQASRRAASSVACYTERWIERKARRVKPKTARTYADALAGRVLCVKVRTSEGPKAIGHIELDNFRRDHVAQWMDWAETRTHDDGTPYATATVRKWWRVFRSVIKDMAADGVIERDYSKRMDAPQTGRSNVRQEEALGLSAMHAIADEARVVTPARYAEITTLVYTGMRTGELWALQWRDIDREDEVIRIRRSVSRGQLTDSTKSNRNRVVPLFGPVASAIDRHRERMEVGQLPAGLVFPSNAGTPRRPGSLRKAFRAIERELELDRSLSAQLIRKSVVTVLRDQGVPTMATKALVGHSDEAIQEHYYSANDDTRELARVLVEGGTGT